MNLFTASRFFVLLTFSCVVGNQLNAQVLSFERTKITLEEGENREVIQMRCDVSVDEVRSAFDEYMDDYHDVKMNTGNLFGKHRIIEGMGIHIDAVSPKEMNLFARIIEFGNQTELSVFGSFGPDVHITNESFPEELNRLENLVMDFTTSFVPKYFQNAISEQRDEIADLRDEISDAEHDIGRNERRIMKLQKENVELDEEIIDLRAEVISEEEHLKKIKEQRSATNARILEIKKNI